MHAEQTCCHGHHKKDNKSRKCEVAVEGAAERHGLSAGRDTTTVHSVVKVAVSVIPTAPAHLEGGLKMTSALSSHTAQKNAVPSSPAHHVLEADCGWLCSRHSRCNQNLVPPRRRLSYASAESAAMAGGWSLRVKA